MQIKSMIGEFCRYVLVGGIAFLFDIGVLTGSYELFFKYFSWGLYVSTLIGFICGLLINYFLSWMFVFTAVREKGVGRSWGAFFVFCLIGVMGLGLTELGMWVGAIILQFDYRVVKIMVTGLVLLWNFFGRKYLVFSERAKQ